MPNIHEGNVDLTRFPVCGALIPCGTCLCKRKHLRHAFQRCLKNRDQDVAALLLELEDHATAVCWWLRKTSGVELQ